MCSSISAIFQNEAERVEVPLQDIRGVVQVGRRLRARRLGVAALGTAAVVAALLWTIPRLATTDDRTSLPPVGSGDVKDNTLLSVDTADHNLDSSQFFVAVNLGESERPTVCFALPRWATDAAVFDGSGAEIARFPGSMGIQESDAGLISCASGDESALARLAASPEEHRITVEGTEGITDATLSLIRAWDFDETDFDETQLPEYKATEAIDRGDLEVAEQIGRQRLLGAPDRSNWDYGNAIHYGHLILGHVALRRDDVDGAARQLLAAGRTPGSPQLDSFGPNMSLARDLLVAGETDAILEYGSLNPEPITAD